MDPIDDLVHDHRAVLGMLEQFERGEVGPMSPTVDSIVRELAIHAGSEELVIYPAAEAAIPGGENIQSQLLMEHQIVKDLLAQIEKADAAERVPLLTAVAAYVRAHVEHEEVELFPRLRRYASEQQLQDMGAALEKTKRIAPTHPHPHAPRVPPANAIADGAAAVLDRVRDALKR